MAAERASTTLLLVRHGHALADDGSYDRHTPLSLLGRRQAEALAGCLARNKPDVVYASPWPRALDTAAPLCAALGLEARSDPRLAELEIDGEFVGAQGSEPEARPHLLVYEPGHQGHPAGETLREFSLRIFACCEWLARRHVGQRVVVFTHSGPIDAAVRWALGVAPEQRWESDLPIETASITELVHWPDGRVPGGAPRYTALLRIGDLSHLGDLVEGSWRA